MYARYWEFGSAALLTKATAQPSLSLHKPKGPKNKVLTASSGFQTETPGPVAANLAKQKPGGGREGYKQKRPGETGGPVVWSIWPNKNERGVASHFLPRSRELRRPLSSGTGYKISTNCMAWRNK